MRVFRMMGLAALLGLSVVTGAAAAEDWDSFRHQMGEYDTTVTVSEQFAASLSGGNAEDLSTLAENVGQRLGDRYLRLVEDGFGHEPELPRSEADRFEALVKHITALGVFPDEPSTRNALESLGTCETAGILIRALILELDDADKQHRMENGRIFIDGTSNDRRYAEALARCQIVRRVAPVPAAVGYSQIACLASRQPDCPEIADR